MSRALPGAALVVAACTLFFGGAARAEDTTEGEPPVVAPERPRIPVAVIELGDFEANRILADALASELNNSKDLKPLDSPIAVNALRENHRDEDEEAIKNALDDKATAENAVTDYKFPEAASAADNGLFRLYRATPTPRVLALSAELAFLLGAARLGERQVEPANVAFRFARTLDPTFKPDAARYLREIVQAFESAVNVAPAGKGWISVGPVPGKVFLDGKERGEAPQTLPDIAPGLHVVWLVGPDRDTNAIRVEVTAGRKAEATFLPETIDLRKRIKRARLALRTAPDPAARAAAMLNLARLLDVKHALLLTESNGKTIVQSWRDHSPGFSALREVKQGDTPADLLAPFVPAKPTPRPPKRFDPPKPPIVVDTRAWYEKPRYQIGGGVVGAVVVGVVIYALASWERTLRSDGNPGFQTRSP